MRSPNNQVTSRSTATTAGYALTTVIVIYSFANVARATWFPVAFSTAMGLPTAPDNAFVGVYAIRTAFVALFALILLLRRADTVLAQFAAVAIIMPVSDAVLVASQGAASAFVAKHTAIAIYLMMTAGLLVIGQQRGRVR